MAKPEQILIIDPQNELKFRGPFTSPVTSYINLTNPSANKVCFKIKTTAPKKYCVRPNSGVLEPSATVVIAVSLQPLDYDTDKNKHKFMVQSIVAPSDDFNLDALWKEASVDNLMDSKLKCVFEMPGESSLSTAYTSSDTEDSKKKETSSSADSLESELQKAAKEISDLKENLSSLQRENLQLKEDVLNARQQIPSQSLSASKVNQPSSFVEGSQITPVIYLACGIIIGLMSILLGKYIF